MLSIIKLAMIKNNDNNIFCGKDFDKNFFGTVFVRITIVFCCWKKARLKTFCFLHKMFPIVKYIIKYLVNSIKMLTVIQFSRKIIRDHNMSEQKWYLSEHFQPKISINSNIFIKKMLSIIFSMKIVIHFPLSITLFSIKNVLCYWKYNFQSKMLRRIKRIT